MSAVLVTVCGAHGVTVSAIPCDNLAPCIGIV